MLHGYRLDSMGYSKLDYNIINYDINPYEIPAELSKNMISSHMKRIPLPLWLHNKLCLLQ